MTIQQAGLALQNRQKRNKIVVAGLLLLVAATVLSDFLYAQFQSSGFYLSESLLFSSYWILFFPLLHILFNLVKQVRTLLTSLLVAVSLVTIHLLAYPALVWLLSTIFYDHSFSYKQTFHFGLSGYLIETLLIYGILVPLGIVYKNRSLGQNKYPLQEDSIKQNKLAYFMVTEGNNRKLRIEAADVLYFSANSPYVNIYHHTRKYLYTGTLKSMELELNQHRFIRIHKSYIVNICEVTAYQSRLNGDYDITLSDHTTLRVSRHYAAAFKSGFEKRHHLTV